MTVVFDVGEGGDTMIGRETNSTEGSTADTGVATGNYSGKNAALLDAHKTIEKIGPIFTAYDPELSAILAMEF